MQQNKVVKNISVVGKYSSDAKILLKTFENINGQFRLSQVNNWLNKTKTKGIEREHIFNILFVFVFVDLKNISQLMHSDYGTKLNHGKDVLYDFLKNVWADWGKILRNFFRQFLKITQRKGNSTDISSPKCLITVDTLLCKTGKIIEHIGKW